MTKSSYFFGQSVFGQLISLIDNNKVKTVAKQHKSDHYVKKFDTSDHLISMLFSTLAHCTSLREVAASMPIFISDTSDSQTSISSFETCVQQPLYL